MWRLLRRIILLVVVGAFVVFLLAVGMAVIASVIALSLVVWIVRMVTRAPRSNTARSDFTPDNLGRENVRVIRRG